MEENIILGYMNILNHLSIDLKLKLISRLSESITFDSTIEKTETASWKSLFGAWEDMDDSVINNIKTSRLLERDVPNFDL